MTKRQKQAVLFGRLVKEYRELRSMTQDKLAKRLGLTRNTVNSWEVGHIPSKPVVKMVVKVLDIPQSEIDALENVKGDD